MRAICANELHEPKGAENAVNDEDYQVYDTNKINDDKTQKIHHIFG
jgi:hypothetical protein